MGPILGDQTLQMYANVKGLKFPLPKIRPLNAHYKGVFFGAFL